MELREQFNPTKHSRRQRLTTQTPVPPIACSKTKRRLDGQRPIPSSAAPSTPAADARARTEASDGNGGVGDGGGSLRPASTSFSGASRGMGTGTWQRCQSPGHQRGISGEWRRGQREAGGEAAHLGVLTRSEPRVSPSRCRQASRLALMRGNEWWSSQYLRYCVSRWGSQGWRQGYQAASIRGAFERGGQMRRSLAGALAPPSLSCLTRRQPARISSDRSAASRTSAGDVVYARPRAQASCLALSECANVGVTSEGWREQSRQ